MKIFAQIALLISCYYLIYFLYVGIQHPVPELGDSWDYHIPIAKTILDGRFLHPEHFRLGQWYYPGSSEVINALFILFHIPLTVSNIFATIVFFLCLWKLGTVFRLSYYYALLFALTFCTLNVTLRWLNAVSIDVWVGVFFTLALILLEHPRKSFLYFIKLGIVLGMLIGSKYTGVLFALVLGVFYLKKILSVVNPIRFLLFFIPFSFFGLFWYIRNYFWVSNPFYPLSVLGFKGTNLFSDTIWSVGIHYPRQVIDAGVAEYKVWIFLLPMAFGFLIHHYLIKRHGNLDSVSKLFLLGLINFFIFLTFPTSSQSWIMVSSFRYSFPAFIPLFLGFFLLAQNLKKEEWVGYLSIGSMIMVTSLNYYPKLMLFYMPLAFILFFLLQRTHYK